MEPPLVGQGVPRKTPLVNRPTLVIVPALVCKLRVIRTFLGEVVKTCPLAGGVIVTVSGYVAETTTTLTGLEVLLRPLLSVATAVSVLVPIGALVQAKA